MIPPLMICKQNFEDAYTRAVELKTEKNYAEILKSLESKIENGKLHLYGSRIIGVGENSSDLDIFVEIGKKNKTIKYGKIDFKLF
jgi:predicted nucleotidyltransferase